jgi:hypothetical protein
MKLQQFGLYRTASGKLVQICDIGWPELINRFTGYYVDPITGDARAHDHDIRYDAEGEAVMGPEENLVEYLGPCHPETREATKERLIEQIGQEKEALQYFEQQLNNLSS